ncbi:MAG: hypothetical protein Q7T10_06615 [Rhodoferax sp.]|uniref:hypothetical protein n=1 Tax=Rhodoferax sp. TaxID=50421 RepID=UPI00271C8D39|nr:hypothetical protein [Rhodoferax sp.]MDO8448464.1 hypothetical protein [Rhodoferax sp.]
MKQHEFLSGTQGRQLAAGAGDVLGALLLAVVIAMTLSSGQANAAETPEKPTPHSEIEDKLGIKIVGLRRSAVGYMVDFRYRVLDPAKASLLLDRKIQPYLLDEATGAQLGVPDTPKVGQLRPTSRNKVIPGRNYYILFANPGRYLQAGSKVTLIAGDARISHLTVE